MSYSKRRGSNNDFDIFVGWVERSAKPITVHLGGGVRLRSLYAAIRVKGFWLGIYCLGLVRFFDRRDRFFVPTCIQEWHRAQRS
jgi:hypothetical protein